MEAIESIIKRKSVTFEHQPSKVVSKPVLKFIIRMRIIVQLILTAKKELGSFKKALDVLQILNAKYRTFFNAPMYHKLTKIHGRNYWRIASPGFPSQALNNLQADEVQRIHTPGQRHTLRLLILSVTSKCPLNCQHCYEWNNLNKKEALTRDDIKQIISKYQKHGTSVFFLGGGEPMLRIDDICNIIGQAKKTSEFWMYTSGFNVGKDEAQQLKKAGLTGMIVSLDHHIQTMHDRFRGFQGAYENAINAILACHQVNLGTALALCTTSEFTTEYNVKKYMELAKKLGVHFVQFIEPKSAGRYAGKDVLLNPEKQKLLEDCTKIYNQNAKFKEYPIINYPESVMRKMGCFSGDRMIYINSAGQIQQCPFCDNTLGHVSDYPVDEVLKAMQKMPCSDFAKSQI